MKQLAACGLLLFLASITAARAETENLSVSVADPYLELRSGPGRSFRQERRCLLRPDRDGGEERNNQQREQG